MPSASSIATSALRIAVTALICMLFAISISAQQSYVRRSDAYAGISYFDSPNSLGFDYTRVSGNLTLTPNLLLNGEKYA
ncbi:MAG: hypothetical protein ABSH09_34160 [Bryobacteraceae bacterium]|jgi:hypothetical protein